MEISAIPALTTAQMAEVDRAMLDDYHIELIQMMENAGRNLAELARKMLGGSLDGKQVVVLCGAGNNGGGGMVAARHLHTRGAQVILKVVANPTLIKVVPAQQLKILNAIGVENTSVPDLETADLVIDALIGYGLIGDPAGPVAAWINRLNAAHRPTLSLDVPSGLDATTGAAGRPCVRANATLTLALPKVGLLQPQVAVYIGALYVANISVPPDLYQKAFGMFVPALFAEQEIVQVDLP